jgi:GNAT superfamily N-acetyltransferase
MERIVRFSELPVASAHKLKTPSHGERVGVRGSDLSIGQHPSPGAGAPPSPRGRGDYLAAIDAIFFDSAATQAFASPHARAAFHELWLGRYLRHVPDWCFAALDADGAVCGYLLGSPVSDRPPLPGPDYFAAFPAELVAAFPAHIHVNVRADCRGHGVGETLIAAFRRQCAARGVPGFHAVTTAGSRSARFFAKYGMAPRAEVTWQSRTLVLLGYDLNPER